ncbi:MAG: caspase family protein [Bacteroidota bacterium]
MLDKAGRKSNSSSSKKEGPNGDNFLFVIAIDEYQQIPKLYNCKRDAKKFIDLMCDHYQFERKNVITLFDVEATEHQLFKHFSKLVKRITPNDNLMVYFSGHGDYQASIDEGYWVPVDAKLLHYEDYISNSKVIKYIKAINSHHTVLIIDSCFSGTLFNEKKVAKPSFHLDAIPSRWVLTAGRNEVVSDGKPGDHSPFADNLLYFLEKNTDDDLSIAELSSFVTEAVAYNSKQTPRGEPLQDVGHRGGQFYFKHKAGVPVSTATTSIAATERVEEKQEKPAKISPIVFYIIGGFFLMFALGMIFFNNGNKERGDQSTLIDSTTVEEKSTSTAPVDEAAAQQARILQKAIDALNKQKYAQAAKELRTILEEDPNNQSARELLIQADDLAWNKVQSFKGANSIMAYLDAFPDGRHANQAKRLLQNIRNTPPPAFKFAVTDRRGKTPELKVRATAGTAPFIFELQGPNGKVYHKQVLQKVRTDYLINLTELKDQSGLPAIFRGILKDSNGKAVGEPIPLSF